MHFPMTSAPTREERLAAQLRENLHRRKAQARALKTEDAAQDRAARALPKTGLPKNERAD